MMDDGAGRRGSSTRGISNSQQGSPNDEGPGVPDLGVEHSLFDIRSFSSSVPYSLAAQGLSWFPNPKGPQISQKGEPLI